MKIENLIVDYYASKTRLQCSNVVECRTAAIIVIDSVRIGAIVSSEHNNDRSKLQMLRVHVTLSFSNKNQNPLITQIKQSNLTVVDYVVTLDT